MMHDATGRVESVPTLDAEPILGCYLYPPVYLTETPAKDVVEGLRVSWKVDVDGLVVHITEDGGLFCIAPEECFIAAEDYLWLMRNAAAQGSDEIDGKSRNEAMGEVTRAATVKLELMTR